MAKSGGKTKRYVEWGKVRKLYEEGGPEVTFSSLARDGWASRPEISKKAKEQSWHKPDAKSVPDMNEQVAKRADAKAAKSVSGEVIGPEPAPVPPGSVSPAAVNAQIELRVNVVDRHRRELNSARKKVYDGLTEGNFDKLKQGKIAAEAFTLIQKAERTAWGLDGDPTIILQVIPPSPRDQDDD